MNETKLRTISQLEEFLKATPDVSFSGIDGQSGTLMATSNSPTCGHPNSPTLSAVR